MTLLSRKADYALLILSYLHHRPEGGNAREIADQYGLSRPFAANILKELCHVGYVTSHRGVKGGYVLQRPAAAVTLAELLEAIGEGFRLTICSTPSEPDEACALESHCSLKGPLNRIHQRIADVLRGVTLATLFERPSSADLLPVLRPVAGCSSSSDHGCRSEPTPV